MMMDKRLIKTVRQTKPYIAANVAFQWCSLLANMAMMATIAHVLGALFTRQAIALAPTALFLLGALCVRFVCTLGSARMSYLSSRQVKKVLREKIYQKLLRLGASYGQKVKTSELVQVAVEGVDQLETYFGSYLPQLFYSLLAPLTLFAALSFVNFPSALVLLVCVPLIPVAIAGVQTWAKKLLSQYWGQYTAMGDTFLENLQGLTTLKIYQADERRHQQMNEEAEKFRKITMKVLTMQLNSITIMDLVAYGGAALGIFMAVSQYQKGAVSLEGCLLIFLLSADFFLPMRLLGSFFHIAMNGMAASGKIFRLLDLPEPEAATQPAPTQGDIRCQNLRFGYEAHREILKGVDLTFPQGSFTALVGESGCGKSTIASLLMGRSKGYAGSITIGGVELSQISEESLMGHITYIGHESYLFKGTVEENLRMGNPKATQQELWQVLERTRLADFLRGEQGLATPLQEKGSNFSGGQRQRLALARALLHDSPVYIFDEATSNIDVESENHMMEQIHALAKEKTVILISHRLANVEKADRIYLLKDGVISQQGTHQELLAQPGSYADLWNTQQRLEQ